MSPLPVSLLRHERQLDRNFTKKLSFDSTRYSDLFLHSPGSILPHRQRRLRKRSKGRGNIVDSKYYEIRGGKIGGGAATSNKTTFRFHSFDSHEIFVRVRINFHRRGGKKRKSITKNSQHTYIYIYSITRSAKIKQIRRFEGSKRVAVLQQRGTEFSSRLNPGQEFRRITESDSPSPLTFPRRADIPVSRIQHRA